MVFDVSLTRARYKDKETGEEKGNPSIVLRLPTPLSAALATRKYNRATIEVTPKGLLVKPYAATGKEAPRSEAVALPEEWS